MTTFFQRYKVFFAVFLLGAILLGATMVLVKYRLQSIELLATVQVTEQEALLATIAETTARNGADSVTESIVIDCPVTDRARHDELLSQLDRGLTPIELVELERLFASCGAFYAERKSVMVARLSREGEVFEEYVTLLSAVTGIDATEVHSVSAWKRLIEGEQTQSVLFSEEVRLQKQIIDELLAGNTASSEEMQSILVKALETREALLLAKAKTDALRDELTSL